MRAPTRRCSTSSRRRSRAMAEIATVARPYAEAAFEAALDRNSLGATADSLQLLAAIGRNEQMRFVLSDPRVSAAKKKELFADVTGGKLDDVTRNLLGLLVDNHRELLLGEIDEQFEALKRDHERVVKARITSAQPLNDQQRADIVGAL